MAIIIGNSAEGVLVGTRVSYVGATGSDTAGENVLSLQLARERRGHAKNRANGRARKKPDSSARGSGATGEKRQGPNFGKRQSLKRLEAENAELRARVVELMLQIHGLRDGD
jgi:hypothetical protein